ncbi:MAG TPA: hypothetical protein VFB76_10940 [Candidatus Angelobacter sp.]|nr:hypothetical protein [Candidatus Angelobacter sp.]
MIVGGFLYLGVAAQSPQNPNVVNATESAGASVLENGTLMYLELSKTVDARKAKAGDQVTAVLLTDVLSHGKIAVRRDSKVIGHVTVAQARTKDNLESRLGIVFDKVLNKHKQEIDFNAMLLAVRPAPPIQIETIDPPHTPGPNPGISQQSELHYPMPTGGRLNVMRTRELDDTNSKSTNLQPTDMEGYSLEPSSGVVVSIKRTVKLEGRVRLELRVGSQQKQAN